MGEQIQNGLQMAETRSVSIDIMEEIRSGSRLLQHGCLARVPQKLRSVPDTELGLHSQTNFHDRYAPQIVSIGPYHHNKEDLKFTDEHKRIYLDSLISPCRLPGVSMVQLVEAIGPLEEEARSYFAEQISFSAEEFVTMMILDGCFILEVLYSSHEYKTGNEIEDLMWGDEDMSTSSNGNAHRSAAAVSRRTWIEMSSFVQNMIMQDLVLLENQLPFNILERLFELTKPNSNFSLNHLLQHYFQPIMPTDRLRDDENIRGRHLLDILRKFLLPSHKKVELVPDDQQGMYNIPNAKKLFQSGVIFRSNTKAKDLFDINFKDNRVLEVPKLYYGEGAVVLFRNLVALEQCSPSYKHQVTSYVIFMSFLVQSKSDVKLLGREGVITGAFHRYGKIATEIHGLAEEISANQYYYHGYCKRLNAIHERRWVKWRVRVTRDHISKLPPWVFYSAAVSLLAFISTILQLVQLRQSAGY